MGDQQSAYRNRHPFAKHVATAEWAILYVVSSMYSQALDGEGVELVAGQLAELRGECELYIV